MGLYLIETNDGRRVLDSDALNPEILIKVFKEIKRKWMEKYIRPIRDNKGELWEIFDRNDAKLERLRENRETVINYAVDCYYNRVSPSPEEFLEMVREKGFYAKFLVVNSNMIYL